MKSPLTFLLCVGSFLASRPAVAGFTLETVDENQAGFDNQVALDSSGGVHVSYWYVYPVSPPRCELRYARREAPGSWEIETLGYRESFYGFADPVLAIDGDDQVHMAYFAEDSNGQNLQVIYGYKDEGGWHWETAHSSTTVGGDLSMAVGDNGDVHLAYEDTVSDDLRYARRVQGTWSLEVADSFGNVGAYADLELAPDGTPGIAYYNYDLYRIKYASRAGGSWSTEFAVNDINAYGCSSLEFDPQGAPHLSYTTTTTSKLAYAVKTGGQWVVEVVPPALGDMGEETSLDLDSNGAPHIVYYERAEDDLLYAVKLGQTWQIAVIATEGEAGLRHDFVLDDFDAAHITLSQEGPGDQPDLLYAVGDVVAGAPELQGIVHPEMNLTVSPNPMRGQAALRLELSHPSRVQLELFDAGGRWIRSLAEPELRAAGVHELDWDGRDLQGQRVPSGVYFLRVDAGRARTLRQVVLIE